MKGPRSTQTSVQIKLKVKVSGYWRAIASPVHDHTLGELHTQAHTNTCQYFVPCLKHIVTELFQFLTSIDDEFHIH